MDNDVKFEKWKMEHASNLAKYNAENACNLAQYNAENTANLEMFKSVILAGQSALKSVILINGGAAVAILAFIGNIWNKQTDVYVVKKLLVSMALFVLGNLTGAVASGFTYLAQRKYAESSGGKCKGGDILSRVIIGLVVFSYLVFTIGAVIALVAFWKQFKFC